MGYAMVAWEDEPPPSPRVVGTVLFPPRSDIQRVSSAQELFAIEVANPHAKPGVKATVSAVEMTATLRLSQRGNQSIAMDVRL